MKKKLTTLALFIITISGFSQNLIYKGNRQYPSTETWNFEINGIVWDQEGKLNVSIGKTETGGIIMLSTEVTLDSYIGGNIYIFLSDGSKITCLDKKTRDNVDNKSIVLYYLTNNEIAQLKENYIMSIRFTIQPSAHGGFNGNKTADNKSDSYSYFNKKEKNYIETNLQVSELFEE